MNSYFTVLRDILKTNTYEESTTTASFGLLRQSGNWKIQTTEELKDEIVSGLITALKDPYLLTPEEVADATLGVFTDFLLKTGFLILACTMSSHRKRTVRPGGLKPGSQIAPASIIM